MASWLNRFHRSLEDKDHLDLVVRKYGSILVCLRGNEATNIRAGAER